MRIYSTTALAQPDAPDTYLHPVLKSMHAVTERMFERGDFERAFPVLGALAVLNGKPSFWQPAAHLHYSEEGQAVQP